MSEIVIATLVLAGSLLSLLAALGLHRFVDSYARLHPAGKSGTLGLALVLIAAVIEHGTQGGEVVTLLFVLVTSPVGTHMITKAMYEIGYRPWEERDRKPRHGARARR